jgi:hypothetical protein
MFHIETLQNQWLIEALIGGAALLLGVVLWYFAEWRPRHAENGKRTHEEYEINGVVGAGKSPLPGIIVFIYVGTVVCAVAYLIAKVLNPPNW